GGLQRGLPRRAAPVLALPGPGSEPGARLRALAPRHDGPERRRGALVPPPGAGNGLVGLGGRRGALRRRSAPPPRPEPPAAHRRVLVAGGGRPRRRRDPGPGDTARARSLARGRRRPRRTGLVELLPLVVPRPRAARRGPGRARAREDPTRANRGVA